MPDIWQTVVAAVRGGGRSTALAPLHLPFGLCLAALLWAATRSVPAWLLTGLGVATGVFTLAYIAAYFRLLDRHPDALRSEFFSIRKLEIEKGLVGDSNSGLLDVDTVKPRLLQKSSVDDRDD